MSSRRFGGPDQWTPVQKLGFHAALAVGRLTLPSGMAEARRTAFVSCELVVMRGDAAEVLKQLMLEDIEIAIAEIKEGEEVRSRRAGGAPSGRRASRVARAFPAHLPRIETVIEPASLECPCGCGRMARIGEDRSRRLDVMAAQYRVAETVRPATPARRDAPEWAKRRRLLN